MASADSHPRTTGEVPIAVVGIGCRFPGAEGPTAYWRVLREGRDVVVPLPEERRSAEALRDRRSEQVGGFLPDVGGFDWRALRVSPREAIYMDPQHRLLLEVAWEAFEDAGLPLERIAGSDTGVFVGISWNDYFMLQAQAPESIDAYTGPGNVSAFAANRISYHFDLLGPSSSIDLACASSLGAVHQACQSLWRGETTLALTGGVSLILSSVNDTVMNRLGVLSRHERCLTLDERADGFVRGEGVGLVVLKRLPDVEPGDRVYATIRGTALGHNGRNEWLVAPSAAAQARVIRAAYRTAGVDPQSVDYVELHGAASAKGDVVETKALAAVVGGPRRTRPCAIGTVKTNMGNLDAAGGIAGLIKTALSLYHRELVPMLHLQTVNPELGLQALGLAPQRTRSSWPTGDAHVPTAGVTSVSMSGCNVHVVMQAPTVDGQSDVVSDERATSQLVPLSARSREALLASIQRHHAWLSDRSEGAPAVGSLRDIAYTTSRRRSHHEHRVAFVARSVDELLGQLEAFEGVPATSRRPPRIAWELGGPPSRSLLPTRALRERATGVEPSEPGAAFGRTLDACVAQLEQLTSTPWATLLDHARAERPGAHAAAIFVAVQLAMADQWRAWGVEPVVVVARGPGSLVLEHLAGTRSLGDALRAATTRRRAEPAVEEGRVLVWQPGRPEPPQVLTTEQLVARVRECSIEVLMSAGGTPPLDAPELLDALRADGWQGATLPWAPLSQQPREELQRIVGALYSAGCELRWSELCPTGRCVHLPSYPWQHRTLWIRPRPRAEGADHTASHGPPARDAHEPDAAASLVERWRAADPGGRDALLEHYLRERVGSVLRCGPEELGAQRSLLELGLDSIMAMELVNRVEEETGARLSTERFLARPTVADLHASLTSALGLRHEAGHGQRILLRPGLAREQLPGEILPLSSAQRAMWTIDPDGIEQPRWNLFYGFHLSGCLHVAALEASLRELVGRHAGLRVHFPSRGGQVVQRVTPPEQLDLTIERYSLADLDEDELEDELLVLASTEARRPHALDRGPLVRLTLIHCRDLPDQGPGGSEHVLFLAFHHAIFDLWSLGLFLDELGRLYHAFASDQPSPLSPPEVGYEDFIAWQRAALGSPDLREHREYFRRHLAGCPARIDLPSGAGAERRLGADSYKFFAIARALSDQAVALSRREGVTLYVTLLAVLEAVLFAHSGQRSLPILSFNAQRSHRATQGMIGMFSNAVILRTELHGDPSFREWLRCVRETALGTFEHQQLPLDEQVAAIEPSLGTRPPLLSQVFFVFQPFAWPELVLDGIRAELLEITHIDNGQSRAELEWTTWPHPDGLRNFVAYRGSSFTAERVDELTRDFQTALARAVEQPGAPLSSLLAGIGGHGLEARTLGNDA